MRDKWYGDNRDLVKWGALLHIAETHAIQTVLQVAFYRANVQPVHLTKDKEQASFSSAVLAHFRDIRHIRRLGRPIGLRIDVFRDEFHCAGTRIERMVFRQKYVQKMVRRIRKLGRERLLVFLDPDTGIAMKTPGWQHVTGDEVRTIFEALKPESVLVLYQHARRIRDWREVTKKEFAAALGPKPPGISTLASPLANDVVFFAVARS